MLMQLSLHLERAPVVLEGLVHHNRAALQVDCLVQSQQLPHQDSVDLALAQVLALVSVDLLICSYL